MGFECSGGHHVASYIYVNLYSLPSFYLVGHVKLEFFKLVQVVESELVFMVVFGKETGDSLSQKSSVLLFFADFGGFGIYHFEWLGLDIAKKHEVSVKSDAALTFCPCFYEPSLSQV